MRIHFTPQKAAIVIFFVFCYICTNGYCQNFQFPYQGRNCDDFSSAFGPRKYGSDNYDFHAGIDIGRYDSQVENLIIAYEIAYVEKVTDTQITLWYGDDWGEELVQYNHVIPNEYVWDKFEATDEEDKWVAAGDVLGTVMKSWAHLDFRYFPDTREEGFQDENASHPGVVLENFYGTDTGPFIIVDGKDIFLETAYLQIFPPDASDPHPPSRNLRYFEIGVRVDQDELDLKNVDLEIVAWGKGEYEQQIFNTSELLFNPENEYISSAEVDYEDWINCGDAAGENMDKGHEAPHIGIYPRSFSRDDPYHTVYFRYYINDDNWGKIDVNKATVFIEATDYDALVASGTLYFEQSDLCAPILVDIYIASRMRIPIIQGIFVVLSLPSLHATIMNTSSGGNMRMIYIRGV